MVLPLDFLVLIVISVLTFTLISVNYVAYLGRTRRHIALYAVATFFGGGFLIGALLGSVMAGLGEQYGTGELLSRWGFTFGWAFMLTLGGTCAAIYEHSSENKVSVTLNVVATLLLGFTLVAGLLFSSGSLPPFPSSIVNLGLAALFTSIFRWVFERRKEKQRQKEQEKEKRSLVERIVGLFKSQ